MKLKDLVPDVTSGKELKLRNMFSAKDTALVLSAKLSKQTVFIKNSSTGEIIGKRSVIS